jgi:hypothetical protein
MRTLFLHLGITTSRAAAETTLCRSRIGKRIGSPAYSILPGFMTPVGSSARLIARITSVASPSSLTR